MFMLISLLFGNAFSTDSLINKVEEQSDKALNTRYGEGFNEFYDILNANQLIRYPNPGESFKADERYFQVLEINIEENEATRLFVKRGINPSEMIDSVVNPTQETIIDCEIATYIGHYYVYKKIHGQEALNSIFKKYDSAVGLASLSERPFGPHLACQAPLYDKGTSSYLSTLGETRHIQLFQFPRESAIVHPFSVNLGYNLACVSETPTGEKLYKGFGSLFKDGPKTLTQVLQHMVDLYNTDPTEEEVTLSKRAYAKCWSQDPDRIKGEGWKIRDSKGIIDFILYGTNVIGSWGEMTWWNVNSRFVMG